MLDKFFKLKENNTNVKTEVVAGFTTFFTMAYIIFVNPNMLSATGMPWDGVFVATILAAIVGTLMMGLYANVPYAQAPGMGLNAFFTYTVCFGLGFSWQQALALVFVCGIINIVVTVTSIRKQLILAIPKPLQNAIGGGIGLFIAYIGVKNAGFLKFTTDPGNYSILPGDTVVSNSTVIPAFVNFSETTALIALAGLILTIVLMVLHVKGAILLGIILTTALGFVCGTVQMPEAIFDIGAASAIGQTAGAAFSAEGLGSLFADAARIPLVLLTAFAFSLTDIFDTVGTFIGTGRKSGIFNEEEEKALLKGKGIKTKIDKALLSDSVATMTGAVLGTSNVTTFVESSAGISAGGRTGLTAVVVAILFGLCIPFAPLFGMVPGYATAPALMVVGVLMMSSLGEIKWADFEEATPCFFTALVMCIAYSISAGISAGFMMYCIVKLAKGKFKEIHPIMAGATLLFLLNYVMMSLLNL